VFALSYRLLLNTLGPDFRRDTRENARQKQRKTCLINSNVILRSLHSCNCKYRPHRAVAQAVSRRHVIAETRVRARASSFWIYGGQSDIETRFSPSSSGFLCQCYSTVALNT
jgi:hypothetical protein